MILIYGCGIDEEGNLCRAVPDDCCQYEPDGMVTIELNLSKSLKPVKVEIFNGTVENGKLLYDFVATRNETTLEAPNGDVSGRAFYTTIIDGDTATVIAIDGDKLKPEDKQYCDDVTCYTPGLITLDLQLDLSK
jgi:hypothetical protein